MVIRSADLLRDTGMGEASPIEAAGALGVRLFAHAARLLGKHVRGRRRRRQARGTTPSVYERSAVLNEDGHGWPEVAGAALAAVRSGAAERRAVEHRLHAP